MAKVHYVDDKGNQACNSKPWWNGIVPEPGVYKMSDGGELHADPLPTTSDWDEVTCKRCQKHKLQSTGVSPPPPLLPNRT